MRRFSIRIRSTLALALALSPAVAAQAHPVAGASPDRGRFSGSADVTFTKWVTSLPSDPSSLAGASMAGVVDGDVGPGTYAGMVLKDDTTSKPGFWLAQALYGFFGSTHSFVARNFITEDDTATPITATIRGVVIWGWMRGARVTGGYTQLDPCPIPTPGNVFGTTCFQGSLHLQLGTRGKAWGIAPAASRGWSVRLGRASPPGDLLGEHDGGGSAHGGASGRRRCSCADRGASGSSPNRT